MKNGLLPTDHEGVSSIVSPLKTHHNGGPFGQLPFRSVPESGPFFVPPEGERVAGVVIRSVDEDSPAQEASLRRGDVITAIDGEPVEGPQDLVEAVTEREPGETGRQHRGKIITPHQTVKHEEDKQRGHCCLHSGCREQHAG